MNLLEHLIYGLISGISRFLPISSSAHQAIYRTFCGVDSPDPLQNVLVDLALLAALLSIYKPFYEQIRGSRIRSIHRLRNQPQCIDAKLDARIVKNAVLPMLILSLVLYYLLNGTHNLLLIAAALLINGLLLYIPSRLLQGNKDGRFMSVMDSYLLGFVSALSAIPGFSGIGSTAAVAAFRGASGKKAVHWAVLLSVPMLVIQTCVDFIRIFGLGFVGINFSFLGYVLCIIGTYVGAFTGIGMIRKLASRNSLSGFAFYSWGAALFVFILYLTVA